MLVVFYSPSLYDAEYFPYPKTPDTTIPEANIAYPDTPVVFRFPDGTVAFYNKPTQELCIRSAGSAKIRTVGDFNVRSMGGNMNLECTAYTSHGKASIDVHAPACYCTQEASLSCRTQHRHHQILDPRRNHG